jgi:Copper transport outer membrane protein, MctB
VFGLRYHVASLAAVFLALAVGVLLGVAISGKVSEAEESFERQRIDELEQDLEEANARADSADRRGEATRELVERAYPALMARRLEDQGFALVFLGPVDGSVRDSVERVLFDADSGFPVRVVALEVPVNGLELQDRLQGDELLASYAGDGGDFGELGEELGHELIEGGETPLWDAVSGQLVEEQEGGLRRAVDGVIVARTAEPQRGATTQFLAGFYRGLASTGRPAVGIETSSAEPSALESFSRRELSTIDHLDLQWGRLALALLLDGGETGDYGLRGEDGILPLPITPVEPEE